MEGRADRHRAPQGSRRPDRQREVAGLAASGYTRPEIARALGISVKAVDRALESDRSKGHTGATEKIRSLKADIENGTYCDREKENVLAYAHGRLDGATTVYATTRAHLESCPGCRRLVLDARGIGDC